MHEVELLLPFTKNSLVEGVWQALNIRHDCTQCRYGSLNISFQSFDDFFFYNLLKQAARRMLLAFLSLVDLYALMRTQTQKNH